MTTAPEGQMSKKTIRFEITQGLVKEPILFQLARKFRIETNIRAASITDEGGFIVLEVEGDDEVIDKALGYLASEGIEVTAVDD